MVNKLLTDELKERFKKYPIYSQDGKGAEATIVCKFFNPYGRGTWYVLEAEPVDDGADYRLFGYVELLDNEYCYFMLSELEDLEIDLKIKDEKGNVINLGKGYIERDMYLPKDTKLKDVIHL